LKRSTRQSQSRQHSNAVSKGKNKKKGKGKARQGKQQACQCSRETTNSTEVRSSRHQTNMQLVQETGAYLQTMLDQRSYNETTTSSSQECGQYARTRQQAGWTEDQQRQRPQPAERQRRVFQFIGPSNDGRRHGRIL
jgi:hypothetical protein